MEYVTTLFIKIQLKNKVIKLRKRGKTYKEIQMEVGKLISKSTLSYWCHNINLSTDYRTKIQEYNKSILYHSKALENLEDAMRQKTNFSRAKREKVQVYLNVFEYELARNLAKENYLKWKDNLFHIQAYFLILLQESYSVENKQKLEVMLNKLNDMQNTSPKSREIYLECKTLFTSHYLHDKEAAAIMIKELIIEFPKSMYPILAKFDIAEKFQDIEEMRQTLLAMKEKEKKIFHYMKKGDTRKNATRLHFTTRDERLLRRKSGRKPQKQRYQPDQLANQQQRFQ